MVKSWSAEKFGLEKEVCFITGKKIKVSDIEPSQIGELGYTGNDKVIHVAYEHPIMDGMNEHQKRAFRKGVVCHELLHQIFTDFINHEKWMRKQKPAERRVFALIANLLEDPAIEHFAPTVVAGSMLSSLRFTIAQIYKKSSRLEETTTPFGQLISALVMFGDMGVLKGTFTFPETQKCFKEIAPLFEQGILEPISSKRFEIAAQIAEIARPLWQAEADFEQMMSEILDELSKQGKSEMKGSTSGSAANPEGLPESKSDKRRKITIKKVTREELEEIKKKSAPTSGAMPEDGDITVLVSDEPSENKDSEDSGSGIPIPVPGANSSAGENSSSNSSCGENPGENKEGLADSDDAQAENDGSSSDASESNSEIGKEGKEDGGHDTESGDGKNNSGETKETEEFGKEKQDNNTKSSSSNSSKNNPFRATSGGNPGRSATGAGCIEEDDDRIDDDEYELSPEDVSSIIKESERYEAEYASVTENSAGDTTPLDEFDISSDKMPKKSCLNYRVKVKESDMAALEEQYNALIKKLAPGITSTTNQLKRIFRCDQEEREYATSGRVNVKRLYCGKMTPRVFDKIKAPAEKNNLAVTILIDESGSMHSSNKYMAARECCVGLAEIFNNLKIPTYIIGFTADTMNYDVVHLHYVTWKNSKADRIKLLNIAARSDNCDGASIRYGAQVLKQKSSKNKLLIVISDGQPAAYNYSNGVADTKEAVNNAKKISSVLGVAVGNSDTDTIHYMYGNDFLHVSNAKDLFANLSGKIKTMIKKWE